MTDPAFYEIKSWQKKHMAMLKGSPESNSVDIPIAFKALAISWLFGRTQPFSLWGMLITDEAPSPHHLSPLTELEKPP